MTRVKICGLMSRADMEMAISAGADSLGFVTEYPVPVPWNIPRERSAELIAAAPPFVTTTAVVGGTDQEMIAIALVVKPHFLELHGFPSETRLKPVVFWCSPGLPDWLLIPRLPRGLLELASRWTGKPSGE